jgi:hypothetical protein
MKLGVEAAGAAEAHLRLAIGSTAAMVLSEGVLARFVLADRKSDATLMWYGFRDSAERGIDLITDHGRVVMLIRSEDCGRPRALKIFVEPFPVYDFTHVVVSLNGRQIGRRNFDDFRGALTFMIGAGFGRTNTVDFVLERRFGAGLLGRISPAFILKSIELI